MSDELDDKSQYPLFGRTVHSNEGNAIPLVIYLRDILRLDHLAVVYVNDAYGNGYVDTLQKAADKYTPDLKIHEIPLDIDDTSMEHAVEKLKQTGYRFVLAALFTRETHDALLSEAHRQGVAGNGLHNWFFSATFVGTLTGRVFEKGSPLHLAYRGVGQILVSGGVEGFPSYDKYRAKLKQLKNPIDMEYLASKFPAYDHPSWGNGTPMVDDPDYLTVISNDYNPFSYEAAIALGLAACEALTDDNILTGESHMVALRKSTFAGVSGNDVVFDHVTGTRDPNSALYKVTNFVEREQDDGGIIFEPRTSHLFQKSQWMVVQDYIFNDGTSNLPIDIAPQQNTNDRVVETALLVGGSVAATIILGLSWLLIREYRRKTNEVLWIIKKQELNFDEPPKILGQGTFGVVMSAQYRGTLVAVKRVVPPQEPQGGHYSKKSNICFRNQPESNIGWRDTRDPYSGRGSSSFSASKTLKANSTGSPVQVRSTPSSDRPKLSSRDTKKYRQMKEELVSEMRYLSRLRHPCVTTLMGK